jgi:hypothetical protein
MIINGTMSTVIQNPFVRTFSMYSRRAMSVMIFMPRYIPVLRHFSGALACGGGQWLVIDMFQRYRFWSLNEFSGT